VRPDLLTSARADSPHEKPTKNFEQILGRLGSKTMKTNGCLLHVYVDCRLILHKTTNRLRRNLDKKISNLLEFIKGPLNFGVEQTETRYELFLEEYFKPDGKSRDTELESEALFNSC
jgi:hypothetical protein